MNGLSPKLQAENDFSKAHAELAATADLLANVEDHTALDRDTISSATRQIRIDTNLPGSADGDTGGSESVNASAIPT